MSAINARGAGAPGAPGAPEARAVASFTGGRAVTAPLTWGQISIWDPIIAAIPNDAFFNLSRVLEPSRRRRVGVDAAASAVGQLVSRHEALRTRIHQSADGPYQEVLAEGQLDVDLVFADTDGAAAAAALRGWLVAPRFDYAAELPLRVGFVVAGEAVTHIAIAFSHATVDGHAIDLVLRDLRLLLSRGHITTPPGTSPAALAAREAAEGDARTRDALAHWRDGLLRIPPTMFPPDAEPSDPPFARGALASSAVLGAAHRLAVQHATSTSTVILAAVLAVMARWTGHDTVALRIISSNRFQADHARIVAPMAQSGLAVLDVADSPSFATLVGRMSRAAMMAYRSGYYQARTDAQVVAEVSAERGVEVNPYACFNDVRSGGDGILPPQPPDPAEIEAARARTTLSWLEPPASYHCRFCVELLHHASDGVTILLTTDTRCLPAASVERYLTEIESLLVAEALD
ncbi:MAG: non-ribosomal peptide synthetase condensation domain protein [Dactylosporangium sp.]|nr:hypothetical protein [Dactylosporangium sp.]NNJ63090.1 non-ribosomal peptide synthetase condensation domain protein [Dactylosporangium sp.]